MYTQCPECETTFKLGADDLRRANGKVRCGDCNHVFNALEFLAEDVEEELAAENAGVGSDRTWTSSEHNPSGELEPDLDAYESSAYLDAEDPDDEDSDDASELAPEDEDLGPILYIGDDDIVAERPGHDEPELAEDPQLDDTDVEFDDDIWEQVAGVVIAPDDETADDEADESPLVDEPVGAQDIVDSVEPIAPIETAETDSSSAETLESPEPEGDDLEFNVPEDKWSNFFGPLPKGETAAVWQPPQLDDDADHDDGNSDSADTWEALTADEDNAETDGIAAEAEDDAPSWKDTEQDTSNSGLYLLGGIALAVMLAAQLIHYNRDRLAASDAWGSNIRTVYNALGSPLYPDWSIEDYEIRGSEAVAGETGRDVLDIRAQIANTGVRATGLPRLRVMLKDRWSNPVAAQDFSAPEYADDVPADGLLQPGDMISAHISIQDPGSGAQGFELELCLPRRDTGLECTGQPFK